MAKYKFKVLAGRADIDGVTYGHKQPGGPYVESDKELDIIYPNKFQRIETMGQVQELTVEEYVKQQAEGPQNAVGKIENFTGRGDEKSVAKVEKEQAKERAAAAQAEEDKAKAASEGAEDEAEAAGSNANNVQDITDKFPAAGKSDLKVKHDAGKGKFSVLDADTGKSVKGSGNLKSEADVNKFLSNYGKKSKAK